MLFMVILFWKQSCCRAAGLPFTKDKSYFIRQLSGQPLLQAIASKNERNDTTVQKR